MEKALPLFRDFYWPIKCFIDVVLGAILLVLALPLILLLTALVKITSRGPGLYRQVRLGRDGRPFTIIKIRTMFHDCERQSGPRWSTTDDPRVTPLGRLLRCTYLDELPQLLNVLRGEMSLVGPRPERPEFIGMLEQALPDYRGRLRVRPGITGLAQVQLPADKDLVGVGRKLAYDLYYVRLMSPGLDARILGATLLKVLGVPFAATRRLLGLPSPNTVLWGRQPLLESLRERQPLFESGQEAITTMVTSMP